MRKRLQFLLAALVPFLILAGMVVVYLGFVQVGKRWFYRRFATE